MAANMWKNSLNNVESGNNKILYETLLDFFYSETVLTFWISIVYSNILEHAANLPLISFQFVIYVTIRWCITFANEQSTDSRDIN